MKTIRAIFAAACAAFATAAFAASDAPRFSNTLSGEERVESGIARLSSDQVASIDALVRRHIAGRLSQSSADPGEEKKVPEDFSKRLTADERRVTGLTLLQPEETVRLDRLVDRHATASVARSLLAPPTYVRRGSMVRPTEASEKREIHGSFMLSYGFGKGGYSEKTGAMTLHFDDPDGRYRITIGYAETHVKGPVGPYRVYHRDLPPHRP